VSLFYRSKTNASWLASLYKKVTRITPSRTAAVIFFITIANTSLLLAFFLPLKTLILVGSDTIPSYMVGLIDGFEKDDYIISLSICAIIFYALYYACTNAATKSINKGAQSLVKRAKKITIFENQDTLAATIYQKVCNVLASVLFFLAGSMLGLVITPSLFSFFLVINITYLAVSTIIILSTSKTDQPKKIVSLANIYSGICFFALFSFVIASYLLELPFDIFGSIIGLLLARQVLQRMTTLIHDSIFLLDNSTKINSLFYTSFHPSEKKNPQDESFWNHASNEVRQQWALNSLIDLTDYPIHSVKSSYVQLGVPEIAGFDILAYDQNNEFLAEYFVKLFSLGRDNSCKHEASLLSQKWARQLPAPLLIGAIQTGGFNTLFFEKAQAVKPQPSLMKVKWYSALSKLWMVDPSTDIADQFSRSKPILPERLKHDIGKRLTSVISSTEQLLLAEKLSENLPSIRQIISTVPLCIVNPDLHMATIFECPGETFVTYNWTRWAVEPTGANWPTGKQDILAIDGYLNEARKVRPALVGIPTATVALTAIMYAIESQFSRQNYLSVIELIPAALEQLHKHSISTSETSDTA